ncbi:MAG: channel protein TolC [Lautropia sp.]|nr:MAG: channel protein TolC [Pseudomonadota bacterium]MBC6960346.1 channel protein TolC [Lautropia sp.]MCL4702180.1 TolC family outer membrane protein [Burkholderiaceae bacterium]MDL1908092.1 TolC family outer membrane protein [Betaproteobacteria bacterium PRO1]RIK87221.1 MAG: channel protein TolC [Burkholderiales bacterium]
MRPNPILKALAAALALGAAAPSFALDLMQAWRAALASDAQLASARSQLEATRERVPQARAGLLPAVNATAAVMPQSVDPGVGPSRDFTARTYAIQLSYPLLRLQNVESFEQSRLQVAAGEAQYAQATQDLALRLSQAYFDVLAAQDNLDTLRAQMRAISEQLAAAKRNFEVGTATITDQQEAQARYDLASAQEIAARNDLEVRRAALAQLIGQPVGELDVLRPGLALEGPQPAREADWVRDARDNNLAVQQQRIAGEIARREIDRQRYGHYPTVDVVGSLQRAENAAYNFVGMRTDSAVLGLQLSIPIYAGGGIEARVREATASHARSQSDLEHARRQAEQGARQAYLGLNSGLAQVNALEAAERSSRLALESNLLGYQVGVRINIDVLNAQQQLYSTQRDLARARYDALLNGLRLKATAGALGEADVAQVNALLVPPASGRRVEKP